MYYGGHSRPFLGAVGLVFCVIWVLFAADSPADCRRITDDELEYIMQNRKRRPAGPLKTPWKAILLSLAVWSLILCQFAQAFVTVALTTYLPLYYRTILYMDLSTVSSMRQRTYCNAPHVVPLKKQTSRPGSNGYLIGRAIAVL